MNTKPENFVEVLQIKRGKVKIKNWILCYWWWVLRTYDESGDYTTRPFSFKVQEQIDNDYKGVTYKGNLVP